MNTFTRSVLFTAMAAVGLTQGCSCSDDDDDPVVINPPPEATVAVSGKAAKGLVLGGIVRACPITLAGINCESPYATAATDDTGSYILNVPEANASGPFAIRVSAGENSTMKCDLAGGCGDVDFGDPVALDSDFELDALVSQATVNSTVNPSMLTHVASGLAFQGLQDGDSIAARIATVQSQVLDRFGISGVTDLNSAPVVDLTNSDEVAAADASTLNLNLLGPAIVSAGSQGGTVPIATAIKNFTTQYTTGGGLITKKDSTVAADVIDLASILARARTIVDTVVSRAGTTVPQVLQQVQTQVTATANDAESAPPSSTPSQGTPSANAGASGLDKTKAFVMTLGDIGTSIDTAAIGDSTVMAETELFETQLQAAEMATSDGLEAAVEATAMTVEAISRAYEALDNDKALTTWTYDGITVAIDATTTTNPDTQEVTLDSAVLTVAQDVMAELGTVAVDMTSTVDGVQTTDDDLADGSEEFTAMGDVLISGTAETDAVSLEVLDTSKFVLKNLLAVANETQDETTGTVTETEDLGLDEISLMLDVKIMEKSTADGDDPISFTGKLHAMISMLAIDESWTEAGNAETETFAMSAETLEFSLWGEVANTTGDLFRLSLSVTGEGNDVTFSEMWSSTEGSTKTNDETAENYVGVSATVNFDANLAGVIGAVKASLTASRTAEMAGEAELTLKWPGNSWVFKAAGSDDDSVPASFTVTNQDGVSAMFAEADGSWTGTITADGTQNATVDGAVVTYSDDSFGSLDIFE